MLADQQSQRLQRLTRFHDCGALSDEEYEREVARLNAKDENPEICADRESKKPKNQHKAG